MTNYPRQNLFSSPEWSERSSDLGVTGSRFVVERFQSLRVAKLRSGILADFETWPSEQDVASVPGEPETRGCDWVVYRKLLVEEFPSHARGLIVTPYSYSPYLDLRRPVQVKKEVLSHILRTERKIQREIGPLSLVEVGDSGKKEWYETWREFELAAERFSLERLALFRHWTTSGPLPSWLKLLSLRAGDTTIAMGLFYLWEGTFYYYAPVMSPDPSLRKYGPGKLFVHKLIEYAKSQGCVTFDFLQGDHDYKFHWNPQLRQLYQCIVPVSLKGRLALDLFRAKRWLKSRLARRADPKALILPALKEAHT